ncbi:hypothetical protein LCX93_07850 [Sulfurimonas sp. SWIR-19]|uniref:hypothetical protein n=1 Tax=Sulfurimonas sp. SWIR-19 TaxID=2878390 RepID=UPI001CF33757|nr:hypothetical protein [Sulfurimonas sp. SWIR-19]UCM99448.1 hypothetical protein LCX93_07850 [Sulfurimonas sp. SWIR-19]
MVILMHFCNLELFIDIAVCRQWIEIGCIELIKELCSTLLEMFYNLVVYLSSNSAIASLSSSTLKNLWWRKRARM